MVETFLDWAGFSKRGFDLLDPWEPVPYYQGGELVALALLKGTLIHFAIHPEHRRQIFGRRLAREFLAPMLARRGYLTTCAPVNEPAATRFLTRLGFIQTWTDGYHDYYMLTDLPFSART